MNERNLSWDQYEDLDGTLGMVSRLLTTLIENGEGHVTSAEEIKEIKDIEQELRDSRDTLWELGA